MRRTLCRASHPQRGVPRRRRRDPGREGGHALDEQADAVWSVGVVDRRRARHLRGIADAAELGLLGLLAGCSTSQRYFWCSVLAAGNARARRSGDSDGSADGTPAHGPSTGAVTIPVATFPATDAGARTVNADTVNAAAATRASRGDLGVLLLPEMSHRV